jgi:hypothetical protein
MLPGRDSDMPAGGHRLPILELRERGPVRKAYVNHNIVGEAVMVKKRLLEETPTNPLTGETFMFSAISKEGLDTTTHFTWRLHPLMLIDWEEPSQTGLDSSRIEPPRRKGR